VINFRALLLLSIIPACSSPEFKGQTLDGSKKVISGGGEVANDSAAQEKTQNQSPSSEDLVDEATAIPSVLDESPTLSTGSEQASPPAVVTGAFLHCSRTSTHDGYVQVGCRIDDENGQKIAPETLGKRATYTYKLAPIADVTVVESRPVFPTRHYDYLLDFKSGSTDKIQQAVRNTSVSVAVIKPMNMALPSTFQESLPDVLIPKPEVSNFSITELITTKPVLDRISGTYFMHIPESRVTFEQASALCTGSSSLGLRWDLASYASTESFLDHGMLTSSEVVTALDLAVDFEFWTSDPATKPLENSSFIRIWDGGDMNSIIHGELVKDGVLDHIMCQSK